MIAELEPTAGTDNPEVTRLKTAMLMAQQNLIMFLKIEASFERQYPLVDAALKHLNEALKK